MATFDLPIRRFAIAGSLAAAVAVAPAVAVFAGPSPSFGTPTASCPAGEHADQFTAVCVPYLVPSSGIPGGQATQGGLNECLRRNQPNCVEQEDQLQEGGIQPGDDFPGPDLPDS